jgi:hypothetical protein
MSAETDLRAFLAADAPLAALVGNRISADRLQQGVARPFVVFVRSSTDRQRGLDGTVFASRVTFDIQAWADTRIAATQVADAVQTALETAHYFEVSRDGLSDQDLDIEADTLSFDWWE